MSDDDYVTVGELADLLRSYGVLPGPDGTRSASAAFERHPGHPDQSVHNPHKKNGVLKKIANTVGKAVDGSQGMASVVTEHGPAKAAKPDRPRKPSPAALRKQRLEELDIQLGNAKAELEVEYDIFSDVHGEDPDGWPQDAQDAYYSMKQGISKIQKMIADLMPSRRSHVPLPALQRAVPAESAGALLSAFDLNHR